MDVLGKNNIHCQIKVSGMKSSINLCTFSQQHLMHEMYIYIYLYIFYIFVFLYFKNVSLTLAPRLLAQFGRVFCFVCASRPVALIESCSNLWRMLNAHHQSNAVKNQYLGSHVGCIIA